MILLLGMKECFNIRKSISVIHHIDSMKKKKKKTKNMTITIDTEKAT